jgi:hypothetical protein
MEKPTATQLYARVEIEPGVWVDLLKPEFDPTAETFPGLNDLPLQSDWENPMTRRA